MMARPHGFDHFCGYLSGLEDQYVLIGGGAAAILMDEGGLDFRATKDVDLVVLTRSDSLSQRLLAYVNEGGYKSIEATEKQPRYYRFQKPENKNCPSIIEIFARNELGLELKQDQYIIPIREAAAEKLSAILLDDEYFDLIQNNVMRTESNIPVINVVANICLKARAYRELAERRDAGDRSAEDKAIQKHLKDIWRLAVNLTGEETISLSVTPLKDLTMAIGKLDLLSAETFKQVMEKTPGANKPMLMSTLKKVFLKT
jgi:hypothetical protein